MAKKGKEEKVTLKNIKEAHQKKVIEEVFQLPALEDHVVDLSVLDPALAVVKAKELLEKEGPKMEEDVKRALNWLDSLRQATREVKEIMEFGVKQVGGKHPKVWLSENLSHEFAPYRRIIWTTLLKYYFSKEVKSWEELQELLGLLCQENYLVETPEGPFKAYKTYALPEKAATVLEGQPELSVLLRVFGELLHRARLAERGVTREKAKVLLSKGKLTYQDFLEGEPGLLALEVSAEREGHRGGVLLVRSDGKRAFPLDAVGGFQRAIEEAKKLEVFLLLQSLSKNKPPLNIEGVDAQKGAKIVLLWHLLKDGISQLRVKEKIQAVREDMKATANLTPEEFFLKRKPGLAFAEYEGLWRWEALSEGEMKETRLENLFFLVERQEEEGQPMIRLIKTPPWLEEFFSHCQGEFKEGEGFGGIPQPLQSVLRAIWGQAQKHSQIENHTV